MLNRLILIFLILVSCHSLKRSKTNAQEPIKETIDYTTLSYERGIVRFTELDGCKYLIHLDNGKRLQPDKLDTAFEKDSMKVWIKYKVHDRMNICMRGITVDVIDIKLRKE
jgi:hypothetical protein